jgi:NADPH:quinone reductase-like Zn-dependent oxidoreductase
MKAIQIRAFGKPTDVAQCVDIADLGAPDANEVVIALEASPINQYDLLMIAGGYGYRPPLPAVVGTEGVGRVIAVARRSNISKKAIELWCRFCTRRGQNASRPTRYGSVRCPQAM